MRNSHSQLLNEALKAALFAGEKILEIYNSPDFGIEYKTDNSPLTLADNAAHSAIISILEKSEIPVLSEEGIHLPYDERKSWEYYWLVDPLDGTKEFIKRNGEFTVNIALMNYSKAIIGVIYIPVKRQLYYASSEQGTFVIEDITSDNLNELNELMKEASKLPFLNDKERPFTIIASRSHGNSETDAIINQIKEQHERVNIISAGSALKFCLVAEGKADFYPRFHDTMEWDTAAGQAIVEGAGYRITQKDGLTPLQYNKENLKNPWFIVQR